MIKRIATLKKYQMVLELAVIQGANAIFPVLIFPFIMLSVGTDLFSKIVLSEALAMYVLIFSLYSFDIISVQKIISVNTNDEAYKVFVLTLVCRCILFAFISILILIIVFFISNTLFFYFSIFLFYPLGMIFQSNYYYQATANNKPLAIFVILSRGIALCLIYYPFEFSIAVKSYYYVSIMSGSYFLSGLMAILYVFWNNKENKVNIKVCEIVEYFKGGYHLFIANIFVLLYRNSNVLILGVISNPVATSIYATAEKIVKCVQSVATPLNQFYLTVLLKSHKSKIDGYNVGEYKQLVYANTKGQLKIMCAIILVCAIAGGVFFMTIGGGVVNDTIAPLAIMSISILVGIGNFMFGSVGLSIKGFKKEFSVMTGVAGCISIALAFIFSYFLAEKGAAMAYVSAELILLILVLKFYAFKKI
ncbi:oligosaccharide flippase family protein [Citrobacter cronae]|uniref:oligosaccharide flippase family protein n=1 Tax=Citrobacter cronae TaxID=1748967 RepID=UPI002D803C8C|nr:oligosaccharide flippase family protein [Citrobacter cronae]